MSEEIAMPEQLVHASAGVWPWVAWFLLSTWVIVLKIVLSTHYERADKAAKRLEIMDRRLSRIEGALGIEDRWEADRGP